MPTLYNHRAPYAEDLYGKELKELR